MLIYVIVLAVILLPAAIVTGIMLGHILAGLERR